MITLSNILQKAKEGKVYSDTPYYGKDRGIRILTKTVIYQLSNETALYIYEGFQWDESSVPWILQWAFPKSGKYAFSALVHDALYYKLYKTRKFVDEEYKKWMKATKISPFQIWFRYHAVRLFGWTYWNKNIENPSNRCIRNRKSINLIELK